MTTKFVTMLLLLMLWLTPLGIQPINGQTVEQTAKIVTKVRKYDLGQTVSVTLRDKTKFKGRIKDRGQDSFTLTDKAGVEKTFAYSEVENVKSSSINKWIILGAVAGAGVTIYLLTIGQRCRNEGANVLCQ